MRRNRLVPVLLTLAMLGASPPPSPEPTPVFELHRTAAASHVDTAKANPLFILVIGSDVRQGDPRGGRADSLHIVAANTVTGRGTIIGIPRDSYVGGRKVNAYLASGGPLAVVRAVAALSGLPIHYWVTTEFSNFRGLVDHLGGIDVTVPYPMADPPSGAFFPAGPRHMNGAEALAFSRARKSIPGGDFGRSENQGRLLAAGLRKFVDQTKSPLGLLHWIAGFRRFVVTDVPVRDLLHLGMLGRNLDPGAFPNVVLPGVPGRAGAASVVYLTPQARAMLDAVRDDAVI